MGRYSRERAVQSLLIPTREIAKVPPARVRGGGGPVPAGRRRAARAAAGPALPPGELLRGRGGPALPGALRGH